MKKVTLAAASIALALGLVGCGEKQEKKVAETQTVAAPAEKPLELGIILSPTEHHTIFLPVCVLSTGTAKMDRLRFQIPPRPGANMASISIVA